jgi:hypothetical protein
LDAQRVELETGIQGEYAAARRSWGHDLELKFEQDKQRGWVFRVTRKFDKALNKGGMPRK